MKNWPKRDAVLQRRGQMNRVDVDPMKRPMFDVVMRGFPFADWVDAGIESGIVWVSRNSTAVGMCGYVCIPAEGHPWSNRDRMPDDVDDHVNVHGGITYIDHPWLGFDTGHLGDVWDEARDPFNIAQYYPRGSTVVWSASRMVDECRRFACALAAVKAAS